MQVKLKRDSNFSHKIKFGSTVGTLGQALPGSGDFCCKVEDLPPPEELTDYTDIVLAVGTNNLKEPSSDPTELAVQYYNKLKSYRSSLPNTRVYVHGVLPTTNSAINARVKQFNKHLSDICNSRQMLTYLDTKVFCDVNGDLAQKFRVGETDVLHVNSDGVKLLASRIKFALRGGLGLANGRFVRSGGPRSRNTGFQSNDRGGPGNRARGNYRGGGRGRGRGGP